jgi:hypothetical protein
VNTDAAVVAFEEALATQVSLGGEAVEEAATALLTALRPALDRLILTVAEEAAAEVTAQLRDAEARVVVSGGQPTLAVEHADDEELPPLRDDLEARLTLRLPKGLKELIEDAAGDAGDSVNAHVVETLHRSLQRSRRSAGRRISGTIET